MCVGYGLAFGDHVVDTRGEWWVRAFSQLILAGRSSSLPKTFANDEGDPLMEGMEQLDTIIGFKDGGTGIARELQCAATRSQNSRSERNLLSHFATFRAGVTNPRCPK